jgi:RNA polymerase sigma-70 factor (ECF subfamily)
VDDSTLLARIRRGDDGGFDTLFRRYYESLAGFAASLLKDQQAGEDVAQDVMLELWRRRDSLDIAESCRSYLFRAVRNRALNVLRHEDTVRRSEPAIVAEMADSVPAPDVPDTGGLAAAIAAAVDGLPEPVRECFLMNREHGLTYPEIASTLGISVKTVEARMGRGLKELRERLAPWRAAMR